MKLIPIHDRKLLRQAESHTAIRRPMKTLRQISDENNEKMRRGEQPTFPKVEEYEEEEMAS